MKFYKIVICIFLFSLISLPITSQTNQNNVIQMAILLDTSGSMDGLIDQAKSQLWKIVNKLALTKRGGQTPQLEVSLYEYGKDTISKKEGYLRMIVPFTQDLDEISEQLFQLTTNGGSEYCGLVIERAVEELKWNRNNQVYKVIFIAGNEPFTQGPRDYTQSCSAAIAQGIIVNTIFCGDYQQGINTNWKDGADLADGKYMNIDQNQQEIYIQAPQDAEILKLNEELNKTYIAYGTQGMSKKRKQVTQDSNAASMSKESEIQRAVTKSSKMYSNESWDMVDAYAADEEAIESMEEKELPEELQGKSNEEIKEYLDKLKADREQIQNQIHHLNQQRESYIAKKKQEMAQNTSLDDAIINAIIEQAQDKGYQF
ncbi:MAG: VWA domain-containing protein [Spirochaetes bacterium]|nr:VWA domain-containing protein [Spirochaetota bacterium]